MATRKVNKQATPPTDQELEELARFEPAFDQATMARLESVAGGLAAAQQRRVTLAVLTRSGEQLGETRVESAETFATMMDAVNGFKQHVQGLLEVANAAAMRMKIADCYGEGDATAATTGASHG